MAGVVFPGPMVSALMRDVFGGVEKGCQCQRVSETVTIYCQNGAYIPNNAALPTA